VKVAVRVRPGARVDRVGGCWDGPRGGSLLVSVRARAVDGQANQAVVGALAGAFELRRAEIVIVAGHRGRDKIVELAGDPETIQALLDALLADSA
jgi:uncharacterized protein